MDRPQKFIFGGPPTDLTEEDEAVIATTRSAAQAAAVPESVSNSDWRVGLLLWEKEDKTSRFDEVEAKVIAARNSGTIEGKIVWQRWEYANDVFRSELLALHSTFGFSPEEVDESLIRGAAVSAAARTA